MPWFLDRADIQFFDSVNEELLNNIIDTTVAIYKISVQESKINMYGEDVLGTTYGPDITVAGLIDHGDVSMENDENVGPNYMHSISVKFHRNTLIDRGIHIELGDIIEGNNRYFEVNETIDNQLLGGQPGFSHSIICNCHLVPESTVGLQEIKQAVAEAADAMYK